MDNTVLAYIAGFFDGEGSINISVRSRKNFSPEHTLVISVGQKDGATLDWIKDNFGGNIHRVKRDGSYIWYCGNRAALVFLDTLRPYLQYKKPQADLAVEFYSGRAKTHNKRVTAEELERREKIREQLKSLHKTIIPSRYAGSTTERKDSAS